MNKFWLRDHELKGVGGRFFRFDLIKRSAPHDSADDAWKRMRDTWEYSHVLRAVLAAIGLVSLVIAVAV